MDEEMIAIGGAAATVFREHPYEMATITKIGQLVDLPPSSRGRPTEGPGRSNPWVYQRVGSKGGAAVLAGLFAWNAFLRSEAGIDVAEPVDTIRAARELVTAAFDHVLTFVGGERTLLANVRRGLEELRAADKTPLTCDPDAGPIVAAARRGMCALFAAWLAPILAEACSPVFMVSARELRADAERMSDLLAHRELSAERQARALCSYWFTFCVVGRAGPTAELRERFEQDVYSGTDGKPPLARLGGVLLQGRHDLPAAAATFARAADELRAQERWAEASDSLSRSGLAYLYAGDWEAAERLFAESAALTERRLGPGDPRISRALSNQADLAARSGRPDRALVTVGQAIDRRREEPGPEGRRRLHLSERVMAFALGECGQVGRAVTLARRLGARGCTEDLLLEAHVLRQAGRVGEALDVLGAAAERAVPATPRNLEALADEAHCLLALHSPKAARVALRPVVENWRWYARRLSARLTFELVVLSAQAEWLMLRPDRAVARLREFRGIARRWPGLREDDPLFDGFGRALAQVLRSTGDLEGARAELLDVRRREERRIEAGRLFAHHPWAEATRLELGECDEVARLTDSPHYARIRDNPLMDKAHPLRLAACLGLVRMALGRGDAEEAAAIMRSLPDPWPLDPDIDVSEEATRLRRKLL